jgi:hypothetical protein
MSRPTRPPFRFAPTMRALLACAGLLVAAGCAPPPAAPEAAAEPAPAAAPPAGTRPAGITPPAAARPAVVADAGLYRFTPGDFGPELLIASTFTAPAHVDVDIANCNGAFSWRLQQRVGDEWVDAWVPAMDACLSAPLQVAAGQTHAATHLVRDGAGAALRPAADGVPLHDGTYRLVWDGVASAGGETLDPSLRTSAPFEVSSTGR